MNKRKIIRTLKILLIAGILSTCIYCPVMAEESVVEDGETTVSEETVKRKNSYDELVRFIKYRGECEAKWKDMGWGRPSIYYHLYTYTYYPDLSHKIILSYSDLESRVLFQYLDVPAQYSASMYYSGESLYANSPHISLSNGIKTIYAIYIDDFDMEKYSKNATYENLTHLTNPELTFYDGGSIRYLHKSIAAWQKLLRSNTNISLQSLGFSNFDQSAVENVEFDISSISLEVGEEKTLQVIVLPETAVNKDVIWDSSDTSVVHIINGTIIAVAKGESIVTVTTKDGNKTASCKVTVKEPVNVNGVSINKTSITIAEGETAVLEAQVSPNNASNKNIKWSSNNTSVAQVDSVGKVTAVRAGKAIITVTSEDGNKTATCNVIVSKESSFNGWDVQYGKAYWYENGMKQGTNDDSKGVVGDGTIRGREIYDPGSDGWYWLDAVYDGAKAVDKEVWIPYIYQNEADWEEEELANNAVASGDMAQQVIQAICNKSGKWVRYDSNGKMYKGWYTVAGNDTQIYPEQVGNTYYYDPKTGLMAKGFVEIDGLTYYFDENTGVLQ